MLLLIPAIDIRNGKSAYTIGGENAGSRETDPLTIAKLLRTENAKSLHVTDLTGAASGRFGEFDLIQTLVDTLDIPVEVSGGIQQLDEASRLLEIGVCRVALHPALMRTNQAGASQILNVHGPSKIVVSIESRSGSPGTLELAVAARKMGFRRLLYTELDATGERRVVNITMLGTLARESGLRITVSGGIKSLEDLLKVQDLEPAGVDSVILRKSLYEDVFSCQRIWRIAEEGNFPYTAKVQ